MLLNSFFCMQKFSKQFFSIFDQRKYYILKNEDYQTQNSFKKIKIIFL